MFNCPDELAPALKKSGIDVVTTGNNHCMDRGQAGLVRTLQVLNEHGIAHTGSFSADPGSRNFLLLTVKGIRVAIVSFSKSTNKIPLPAGKQWMVNLIDPNDTRAVLETARRAQKLADLVIVCLHHGREYRHTPPEPQNRLARELLRQGVHIVLGSHPHVLQPLNSPSTSALLFTLRHKYA